MNDQLLRYESTRFREFGEIHIPEMSPFYAALSVRAADDPEILAIAAAAGNGQPTPNLLFAAARFLLDSGADDGLLACYPVDFGGEYQSGTYAKFREFVLRNESSIRDLVSTKKVQSNVVRRSAILVAGLTRVSKIFAGQRFTNIEIGASAGMTLMWDRFSYRYGDSEVVGDRSSPVLVKIELRGTSPFSDPDLAFPVVAGNIGIELDPVAIDDAASIAWLRALIFPEHNDNRLLFDSALEISKKQKLRVEIGDAVELIPGVIDNLPHGQPVNIYHSHTLNQFSREDRERLDDALRAESRSRLVTRLGFEATTQGHSDLRLIVYENGLQRDDVLVANCEAHGRWIEWLDDPI